MGDRPPSLVSKILTDAASGRCFLIKNGEFLNAAQISWDLVESFESLSFSHVSGDYIYRLLTSKRLGTFLYLWSKFC